MVARLFLVPPCIQRMDSGKVVLAKMEAKPIHLPGYVANDTPLGQASQDHLCFKSETVQGTSKTSLGFLWLGREHTQRS